MVTTFGDPFDTLLTLQQALEAQLTSDWLQDSTTSRGAFPPINVFRQGEDLLAIIELPGIDKNDLQVGSDERKVVIAAIPENYIRLALRGNQDAAIIDTGEHDAARYNVRLVLLTFLDRACGRIQVGSGEALDGLPFQYAIGHGMAQYSGSKPSLLQECGQPTGGL